MDRKQNRIKINVLINEDQNALLIKYCETVGLNKGIAGRMLFLKSLELITKDGEIVGALNDVTTVDRVVQKTLREQGISPMAIDVLAKNIELLNKQNQRLNEQLEAMRNELREQRNQNKHLLIQNTNLLKELSNQIGNISQALQSVNNAIAALKQWLMDVFKAIASKLGIDP